MFLRVHTCARTQTLVCLNKIMTHFDFVPSLDAHLYISISTSDLKDNRARNLLLYVPQVVILM